MDRDHWNEYKRTLSIHCKDKKLLRDSLFSHAQLKKQRRCYFTLNNRDTVDTFMHNKKNRSICHYTDSDVCCVTARYFLIVIQ